MINLAIYDGDILKLQGIDEIGFVSSSVYHKLDKPVDVEFEAILEELNTADNVASKYWFRMLNVQPREGGSRSIATKSLLFVSSFNISGGNFMENSDSGDIIK